MDQTAILRDLMTQDPTSTSSLAQQLADPAYLKFAQALSTWSPPPFSTQSGIDSVVSGYQESSFETSVGQDNGALQEALYFSKNAVGLTQLSQIMADKPLLDVVTTALGIPAAFGSLDYDQQVAILQPRLDMSQFATASGVSSFITKYLAMDQLQQSTSGADPDPILSLFNNTGSSTSSTGLSLTTASFSSGALNLMA